MTTVELSAADMHLAADIGRLRQARNRGVNRDRYAPPGGQGGVRGEVLHTDGAHAQLAVATWLGGQVRERWLARAYEDTDHPRFRLVGGWAVRSTRWPQGHLLLHPYDRAGLPYLLVITAAAPVYKIAGWAWGWQVMLPRFWDRRGDGAACFYVPQSALAPV